MSGKTDRLDSNGGTKRVASPGGAVDANNVSSPASAKKKKDAEVPEKLSTKAKHIRRHATKREGFYREEGCSITKRSILKACIDP